jgi:hypothetical protein
MSLKRYARERRQSLCSLSLVLYSLVSRGEITYGSRDANAMMTRSFFELDM